MAGGHPEPLRQQLAGVHRAAADLALLVARREQLAGVDAGGQRGLVAQHAVHAQHVRHEVVGEDREPVEVVELGHAGEREVVRGDLGALPEATSSKKGMPAASIEASRSAEPPASATTSIARRAPRKRPRSRSASAYSAISSWPGSWPSTAATSSAVNARSSSADHPPDERQKSVSDDATVK